MPAKKKPKQVEPNDDDELEFLMAAAAAKKAKSSESAAAAPTAPLSPTDTLYSLLPPPPSLSFPSLTYPPGETQEYAGHRPITAESRDRESLEFCQTILPDLREGAEVHRRVRQWAMQHVIKPGVNLFEMCSQIEEATRRLSGYQPITRGLAFPCGCSLNNCAAHYTPNRNDGRTLAVSDVMKIDFGVNVNGNIIDSAFTVCFDDRFAPLLQSARDATNVGVRTAGIDARLNEIGDAIHEVFDAAALEIDGKHYDIKPVANLSGHLMRPFTIHAGKSIPIARGGSGGRMEEGELYACETFGTTGRGRVNDQGENLSHYMVNPNPPMPRTPAQRKLLKVLQDNFSTLAFCPRFLEHIGERKYAINLRQLGEVRSVIEYPALSDVKGSWVAQFEHSFILLPTRKEVLSRGDDY